MNLRIVLADDHPVVLIGARATINDSGVGQVVAEAHGTDELLQVLASTPCDVLVTDFSMPGGDASDGITLIKLLRRKYPRLPIVMLTMLNNAAVLRTLTAAGVLGVVEKVGSMSELPVAIQAASRGRAYIGHTLREKLEDLKGDRATAKLSPKEAEVVRLLASGLSVTRIAQQLQRSVTTISTQKNQAMRKLGIDNDADLHAYAREHGLHFQ